LEADHKEEKTMFKTRKTFGMIRGVMAVCLTALAIMGVYWGAAATKGQADAQALRMTEESIRRAAVQCYALEGVYPVNIQYLMDHYGIRPDTDRFVVHYEFVADNLLPVILVLPMGR
jgi:hypothetical protein